MKFILIEMVYEYVNSVTNKQVFDVSDLIRAHSNYTKLSGRIISEEKSNELTSIKLTLGKDINASSSSSLDNLKFKGKQNTGKHRYKTQL